MRLKDLKLFLIFSFKFLTQTSSSNVIQDFSQSFTSYSNHLLIVYITKLFFIIPLKLEKFKSIIGVKIDQVKSRWRLRAEKLLLFS
jgi:hypothetical protein